MQQLPETLRDNVHLLGVLLGETLKRHEGEALFHKVEDIRSMAISLAQSDDKDNRQLIQALSELNDSDILPICRAFNQFLNLANIADQQYATSAEADYGDDLQDLLDELGANHNADNLFETLQNLRVDTVLTAHPTEVTRRTLIQKYDAVTKVLADRRRNDLLPHEMQGLGNHLHRLVDEIWSTDEIRRDRPTALDEAKWGFAVIENSLWQAVPDFIRHFDRICQAKLGKALPLDFRPFRFYSWMGGDRDGNPNVTHQVTEQVILLGRWKAADLLLRDVKHLYSTLSMHECSAELSAILGEHSAMPYRKLLRKLITRLQATLDWSEECINNKVTPASEQVISARAEILDPLELCYRSLLECEHDIVAKGPLTDTIRRVYAFGMNLAPLDIRQDGDRHVQALDELTHYLDMGNYREWDESTRQKFLMEQLQSKRPLIPAHWPHTEETEEVLATCRVVAAQPREALSHYVISMARHPSDVLAVALLLKECGMTWSMPISPLFETLDDLDRAPSVMNQLWQNHWYQRYSAGAQTVMIGYSDSAKDAGKFAATWAQYKAQEQLVSLAEQHQIKLVLFHGRGGTVGRGGGPVKKAMASQPPGSVKGRIRVTVQGEMIRYTLGMPRVAFRGLSNYLCATVRATLMPAPAPKDAWRQLIEEMSTASLNAYRHVVRGNENFVEYFRSLTPEQELGKLALGSRPARRKSGGGIETLRAIPWVFAWMQVRLNLPSWLGIEQALACGESTNKELLDDMVQNWPFFSSLLDLLEMVLGKADGDICRHYEQLLVDPKLHGLGEQLRHELAQLEVRINRVKGQRELLENDRELQLSIDARKPYMEPLNYLQAELLKRERKEGDICPDLDSALKVTMAGISAGMRNTG